MPAYNARDNGYEFESFVRDFKRVNNVETVDFEDVLKRYFDGNIDEYVTDTECRAFDAEMSDTEMRQSDEAHRAITAISLAAVRHHAIVGNVLKAFMDKYPEPFLIQLGNALDEETRDLLRFAADDASLNERESRAIARLAGIDFDGLVNGTATLKDSDEPDVVYADAVSDFPGKIFSELREGAFPATDRRMTVTEARRRVMAHTGKSERAVIRDTRGWDADRIISLIA